MIIAPVIKVYKDGQLLGQFEFYWSFVELLLERCAKSGLVIDLYPEGINGPVLQNLFQR
jgi:hypothetical protein